MLGTTTDKLDARLDMQKTESWKRIQRNMFVVYDPMKLTSAKKSRSIFKKQFKQQKAELYINKGQMGKSDGRV